MFDFQLYHTDMSLEMPFSVIYARNKKPASVRKRLLLKQTYVFWPNGSPCTLINVWLQSITAQATGNSAETFASHISHFVRYCFSAGMHILSVDDTFLLDFSEYLLEEKQLRNSVLKDKRSPNHVAYTIRRVIDFYIWYQTNYRLTSQPKLIGELGTGAKITIEWRINSAGQPVLHHPAIPSKRPPVGDKKPIPDDFIAKINDTIYELKTKPRYPFGISSAAKRETFIAKNEYLYSRRLVTLKITKLTGLRPDELNTIPLHLNLNPLEKRVLCIPTLKTRKIPKPIRNFPLTLEDAIEISIYFRARNTFLLHLNIDPRTVSAFMLAQDGSPIETRSLARDFRRLCELSGLANVQVCLSMFRHRFITTQIAYEVRAELRRNIAQKDLWKEAVQRRILAKVAMLTGHLRPMSLISYYDEGLATAIAQAPAKTLGESSALIVELEARLSTLSRHATIYSDPGLARSVAEIEKLIAHLKGSQPLGGHSLK